jgi:hypothetical protein
MSSKSESSLGLISAFRQLGQLVNSQAKSASEFNSAKTYGDMELDSSCLNLLSKGYEDMQVGQAHEHLKAWNVDLHFKGKGIIDEERLYTSLRKLDSKDLLKIRCFNRFVGQQLYNVTFEEFFEHQESKAGKISNAFYTRFMKQSAEFAQLFEQTISSEPWPAERISGDERGEFVRSVDNWRKSLKQLPGLRTAHDFFTNDKGAHAGAFNSFFHLQRQFDAPNYKDTDAEGNPNPQPLARIAAYRDAMSALSDEFTQIEKDVTDCFDQCRLDPDDVVIFVLNAEDAFLNITCRLDDEYPREVDFVHHHLHERSH